MERAKTETETETETARKRSWKVKGPKVKEKNTEERKSIFFVLALLLFGIKSETRAM